MKTIISFMLMAMGLLVLGPFALAQTQPICGTGAPIQWNLNTEPDMQEYRLYTALSPSSIDPHTQDPNWVIPHDLTKAETLPDGTKILKATLDQAVPDGLTYFAVTAVDTSGNESGLSNELACNLQIAPKSPTGLVVVEFGS